MSRVSRRLWSFVRTREPFRGGDALQAAEGEVEPLAMG